MAKKTKIETVTPKYNPSAQYQWRNDSEFTFSGVEFDMLHKALTKFTSGSVTDMSVILSLVLAANVMQSKLVQYVEKGTITEVAPTT